jgi:hypothetical protein
LGLKTNINIKNLSGNYKLELRLIDIQQGGIEINSIRSTKNVIDNANIIEKIEINNLIF